MTTVPITPLHAGTAGSPVGIPQLGCGTYQIEPAETVQAGLDCGEDGRTGPNPDTFDYLPR